MTRCASRRFILRMVAAIDLNRHGRSVSGRYLKTGLHVINKTVRGPSHVRD